MSDTKISYLSMIEIFQDLSPDQKAEIDQATTMTTCENGRIFYMPEDTGEVLFLLKKGRVQLYRMTMAGKKIVVATLDSGAIFGEMALIGTGMHNTYAEAVDDCLLCVMSRVDLERLILQHPKVGLRLMQSIGERLSSTEQRLEEIAFKSIPARLAGLLLRIQEDGETPIIKGYTHQDLAEILGTYRETTTQTLNEFKTRGLIKIGRKRIELLDLNELHSMAQA